YGIIDDPQDLYKRVIEFNTVMEEPQGRRNPGCFDYRKYLKSCGIWAVADIDSFEIVWSRDLLIYKLERSLMKNKERFIESLPGEARGLTAGILFGDTSRMKASMRISDQRNCPRSCGQRPHIDIARHDRQDHGRQPVRFV
ncbi:MAG: hypothetical protein ACLTK0_09115, partial [Anaerovoracaceae bacterium]